jgi:hypothetical protein
MSLGALFGEPRQGDSRALLRFGSAAAGIMTLEGKKQTATGGAQVQQQEPAKFQWQNSLVEHRSRFIWRWVPHRLE